MEPDNIPDGNPVTDAFKIGHYLVQSDKKNELDNEYNESVASSKGENSEGSNVTDSEINVDTTKFAYGWLNLKKTFYYINAKYGPEEIFTNTSANNKIPILNINFFSEVKAKDSSKAASAASAANDLRKAIAGWYVALRNLSIVGLLCVLVYLGIRIVISSSAADKAKYKQLLKDWFIGLCLLFTMHYIMAFTITIVETIVTGINQNTSSISIVGEGIEGDYKTNLIGAARFQTQYKNIGTRMPFVIMYIALVVYTVIFTVFYLKRALMMAFLTMIAPLVAFTYPIDKVTDGKAQAFDAWLKEFVYNALIQPFHLIIYTVFVTNALNFAKNNVFYMIASLWFIMKAESILRGFFGFNKARGGTMEALHTVGLASMLGNIARGGSKIRGAANDARKQVKEGDDQIRFSKGVDLNQLADGQEPTQSGAQGSGLLPGNRLMPGTSSNEGANVQPNGMIANVAGAAALQNAGANEQAQAGGFNLNGTAEDGIDAGLAGTVASATGTSTSGSNNSGTRVAGTSSTQSGFQRLWRANAPRLNRNVLARKGWNAIKGFSKFAVKTTYTAGLGALAGAIAIASGGDLGAALAAGSAGMGLGQNLGNRVTRGAGRIGSGIRNSYGRTVDTFNGNSDIAKSRKVNQMLYGDNNFYNYVRDSMTAKNNGVIPSNAEVEARLQQYTPFIERGFNVKEAEKAMKVADSMGISGPENNRDYNQAALMLATGKDEEITKAVLNKEADRAQYMENFRAKLSDAGVDNSLINSTTDKEFSFMEKYYGVEDHKVREAREQQAREVQESQRAEREQTARIEQEQREQAAREREIENMRMQASMIAEAMGYSQNTTSGRGRRSSSRRNYRRFRQKQLTDKEQI